jgi:cytochrome c biogenesis protein ResB
LPKAKQSERFNRALRWAYVMTLGRHFATAVVTGVLVELDRMSAFLLVTIPAALVALSTLLVDPRVREWLRDARATVLRPRQAAE